MKLWDSLKHLNSGDLTPAWTKFNTLYFMPLAIIALAVGFFFVQFKMIKDLSEFEKLKTLVPGMKFELNRNKAG